MRAITTALTAVTLFMGAAAAQQQLTGAGPFCIKGPTGPAKCDYQTMAQCEQARPAASSDQCIARAQAQGAVGGPASGTQREQPSAPGEQKD